MENDIDFNEDDFLDFNALDTLLKEKEGFDPEGSGYDDASAEKYGLKPTMGEDGKLHWQSRVPQTGLLLKGRKHETWDLLEKGEEEAGYEIYKSEDGRYYSRLDENKLNFTALEDTLKATKPTFRTTSEDVRDKRSREEKKASEYPLLNIIDTGLPSRGKSDWEMSKPYREMGEIGFWEDVKRTNAFDVFNKLPFDPFQTFQLKFKYMDAKKRLEENEGDYSISPHKRIPFIPWAGGGGGIGGAAGSAMAIPPVEARGPVTREEDEAFVKEYEDKKFEEKMRGVSIPSSIKRSVARMVPWMAEIAVAKGLTPDKITAALPKMITTASIALATQPHRIADRYADKRIENPSEPEAISLVKAYGGTWIANFSELTGEYLVKGGKKILGPVWMKMPFGKKFLTKLYTTAKEMKIVKSVDEFADRIGTQVGYDGLLGEMGEERVETILNAVLAIEDFGAGPNASLRERLSAGMAQDLDPRNLLIETATLATPGVTKVAAKVGISAVVMKNAEVKRISGITKRYNEKIKTAEERGDVDAVKALEEAEGQEIEGLKVDAEGEVPYFPDVMKDEFVMEEEEEILFQIRESTPEEIAEDEAFWKNFVIPDPPTVEAIKNTVSERINLLEKVKQGIITQAEADVLTKKFGEAAKHRAQAISKGEMDREEGIIRSDKTDLPIYDQWMARPDYAREAKGVDLRVEMMSPDEYIDRVARLQEVTREETLRHIDKGSQEYLRKQVEAGEQLFMPVLDYKAKTQEGRNRAMLAKEMGQEEIPVLIVEETSLREDKLHKAQKIARDDKAIEAREEALAFGSEGEKLMEDLSKTGEEINPYDTMPIEEVEEMAAYGVRGAKEALVSRTEIQMDPATDQQVKQILHESVKYGLQPEHIQEMVKEVTGLESLDQATTEDAENIIDHLNNYSYMDTWGDKTAGVEPELLEHPAINKNDKKRIMRGAGSNLVYNRAVTYALKLGALPTNPDLPDFENQREGAVNDIMTIARYMKSGEKRREKTKPSLSSWQNVSLSLDKYERRTGSLVRRMWSDIVATARKWTRGNEATTWKAIKDAGLTRLGIVASRKQSTRIAQYLNETDESRRANMRGEMSEKMLKLSDAMEGILQTRGSFLVRWARFVKWDYYARKAEAYLNRIHEKGKTPSNSQIARALTIMRKKMPPNAPMSALGEGRRAREDGRLHDWLSEQTWGTRKRYYMTTHELASETAEAEHLDELSDSLESYLGGSISEEAFDKSVEVGELALGAPGETEARRGEGEVIESDNIALDVIRHLDRLAVFASTYDQRAKFWSSFLSAKPVRKDIGMMRRADSIMRGIYSPTKSSIGIIRAVDRMFWRAYLVFDPTGSLWFAWRQAWQNLTLGPSQFNANELQQSIPKFMSLKNAKAFFDSNPDAAESFEEYYQSHVSEGRAHYRYFIMKEPGISGMRRTGTLGRAAGIIDALAIAPQVTDRMNRRGVWPVAFDMAQRNIGLFASEKIGVDELWHRLALDNVTRGQSLEFRSLLAQENYGEFIKRYAEYKTENIHFRYHPSLRGLQEMDTTGRTLLGLIVFPRGYMNTVLKGGIEPIAEAARVPSIRNIKRAYSGLKLILKFMAGTTIAGMITKHITGRAIYDPRDTMSYNLGSPGFGKVYELMHDVGFIQFKAAQDSEPMEVTTKKVMKLASNQLEMFIPLCEVYIREFEIQKNIEQVKLWKLLKHYSLEEYERVYGERWNPKKRSTFEKWSYRLLGKEAGSPEEWREMYNSMKEGEEEWLKERKEWKF